MGVVTCADGEEGRGEEGVTLPEGSGREGGGRQGSIVYLPLLSWGVLLSGLYCETFPLTGPYPL